MNRMREAGARLTGSSPSAVLPVNPAHPVSSLLEERQDEHKARDERRAEAGPPAEPYILSILFILSSVRLFLREPRQDDQDAQDEQLRGTGPGPTPPVHPVDPVAVQEN
jgi:hypothetical protein